MQNEWKELIALLNSHEVEYIVVGAHALAYYGRPRYTEDIDIFLRRSAENGKRLRSALLEFGLPVTGDAISHLMNAEKEMIILGRPPIAIDLLNFIDGVEFSTAWPHRVVGELFGQQANVLSKRDYIATKIASGRPKDIADLALLEEVDS